MPTKGSSIFIEPIRDIMKIMAIRESLQGTCHLRDDLLFVMGINNCVQISTLLRLTVGDVKNAVPGTIIRVPKKRTDKTDTVVINSVVYDSLSLYLESLKRIGKSSDDDMLFQSRKGGVPLSLSTINALVKSWAKQNGLEGNYGAATLRKTWGYHQRERFGVTFAVLKKRFGHTSSDETAKYLGYTPKSRDAHHSILGRNEIGVMRSCQAAPAAPTI